MRHKESTTINKTLTMLFCPCRINKCKCRCVENKKTIKSTSHHATENEKTNESVASMSSQIETEEQQYNKIKQRMKLEDKARKELDDEKWDAALQRVRDTIGISHANKENNWQLFISCLRFYKVKPNGSDDDIIIFILMRMISALFLHFLSLAVCGLSILLLIALFRNAWLCVWYLINPHVLQEPLIGMGAILVGMLSYVLWVGYGLLRSASTELEYSKNKTHISMVFGIVVAIVIAIITTIVTIVVSR